MSTVFITLSAPGNLPLMVEFDLGSKCHWFETRRRHCVVSLSKTLYPLLSTDSTQEDMSMSQHD